MTLSHAASAICKHTCCSFARVVLLKCAIAVICEHRHHEHLLSGNERFYAIIYLINRLISGISTA